MSCYYPLIGIPNGRNPNGKINYAIKPYKESVWQDLQIYSPGLGPAVKIPCGKCIGCRLDYSRQWANRCMLEAQYYPKDTVWFATITYNQKYVPKVYGNDFWKGKYVKSLTLRKRDFQLWMKRLRRHFPDDKIRFFAAGEYGSETMRPHYHAILFGLHLVDLEPWEKSGNFQLFTSKSLAKTWSKVYNDSVLQRDCNGSYASLAEEWFTDGDLIYEPYGRIVVSPCTWETCAYTARYTAKKSNTAFPELFERADMEPPFTLMSRRPGIGRQYYEDHPDLYNYRYIHIPGEEGGIKFTAPRYFDRLLEQENPELLETQKQLRREIAEQTDKAKEARNTYGYANRLKVEEAQKQASAKMLRRSSV
jgi:hypothetical protein